MMTLYHALGYLFGWLMRLIYMLVKNYGLAIFLFTFVTRIILFPISYKQIKNSSKMRYVNPQLEKLRKSYKDNPQKLQEEQMKLYRKLGINPMGSCLPMIIQFIILFGVLDVVYRPLTHILRVPSKVITAAKNVLIAAGDKNLKASEQLRDELYILRDSISGKYSDKLADVDGLNIDKLHDFYDRFQLFGVHLGEQPHFKIWAIKGGPTGEDIALFLIPFIAGALQLILTIYGQRRSINTNQQAQQMRGMNAMMYIMPLFSVWFAFIVPAGVGFYWICSSFFSLITTVFLNNYFSDKRVAAIQAKDEAKAKKRQDEGKISFYERAMQAQNAESMNLNAHKEEVDEETKGMSRKQVAEFRRNKMTEARKKMAEKYGEEYTEDKQEADNYEDDLTEEELNRLNNARKKMAEKYGEY